MIVTYGFATMSACSVCETLIYPNHLQTVLLFQKPTFAVTSRRHYYSLVIIRSKDDTIVMTHSAVQYDETYDRDLLYFVWCKEEAFQPVLLYRMINAAQCCENCLCWLTNNPKAAPETSGSS